MAAIDFPTATSNGQTFEADSGVIYTYVGTPPNGFWSGTFGTAGLTTLDGRYIAKNDSNTIQTIQTQGLKFNSGNADTILIDGLNSRIGIGTTSPTRNLTVSSGTNAIIAVQNSGQSTEGVFNAPSGGTINLGTIGTVDLTLSTNSIECFRIDSSGNVGIGESDPQAKLHVKEGNSGVTPDSNRDTLFLEAAGNAGLTIGTPNSNSGYVAFGDPEDENTGQIIYRHASDSMGFFTAGTERMLINSSGGTSVIGDSATSQPGYLSLLGGGAAVTNGTEFCKIDFLTQDVNVAGGDKECARIGVIAENDHGINSDAKAGIAFFTRRDELEAPSEKLRINNIGNVGIGTQSPGELLHISALGATDEPTLKISSENSNIFLRTAGSSGSFPTGGAGNDAELLYIGGDFRIGIGGANQNLIFFNGNGYTERMRIDNSGNVGIGTSNPTRELQLGNNTSSAEVISLQTTTTGNGSIYFGDNVATSGEYAGVLRYSHSDNAMQFWTSSSEQMRLDSSGELLIGTTHSNGLTIGFATTSAQQNGILYTNGSPYSDTDIYGCGLSGAWKGRIKFYTSNNGAASLAGFVDEEGNLALGRTNFSVIAYGQTSGDGQWLYRRSSGAPNYNQGSVIQSTNADGGWAMMYLNKFAWNTGDDQRYLDLYKNGQTHARLQLTANGANVELTNQSDYRLKENVETYTGGLDAIKALRVCQFDWISNPSYPYKTVGFIAHEVDEILDDIVTGVKDGTRIDEGGNEVAEYQSLDQSRLVPYLTSALQEAIAKIETLELPNKNPINIRQTTSLLNNPFITFLNSSGDTAGSIIQNGVNSVTYATSSDYRLKDNVVELTAAIPRLKQLAPKRFNFTAAADVTVDGFLAHEAQAVVPEAVTGSHNQVDGDGNPVMQGIDQSKLVPLLTAALQEAIGRIETLEAKVATLEGS